MWRSGKNPPKVRTSKLPPSEKVLLWAKDDREKARTQFHYRERTWDSTVRAKGAAPEVEAAPKKVNPALPAWMQYRSKPNKAPPIYFRTKAVDRKKTP